MVVLLIGQQGSGKSTLGHALGQLEGCGYVSGGVLIRREIAARTAIGLGIKEEIADGERISPVQSYELLRRELECAPAAEVLILDGFPQEAGEHAELAEVVGEPDLVLLLSRVRTDELVRRIENRLECPDCNGTFARREAADCPKCGTTLARRAEDDDLGKIAKRHRRWAGSESGLISLYDGREILAEIDARQSPEVVKEEALHQIEAANAGLSGEAGVRRRHPSLHSPRGSASRQETGAPARPRTDP